MTQGKPLHILLADDDEDDTFLFTEALEHIAIEIKLDIAENGIKLMHKLKNENYIPDLIFLDMNMPVKNGLECLTEIRNSAQLREVPVIILSTSVAGYLLESAHKEGANLYIQKPTSFYSLVEVLKKCLLKKEDLKNAASLEHFLIPNNN